MTVYEAAATATAAAAAAATPHWAAGGGGGVATAVASPVTTGQRKVGGSEVGMAVKANGRQSSNSTSGQAFVPPPKGFFAPSPTKTVVGLNNGYPSVPFNTTGVDRQTSSQHPSPSSYAGDAMAGAEPSSVPKGRSRPRRESIGQMRRKASDSATAAASAGGIGIAFANRPQPIPTGRGGTCPSAASRGFSTSPRFGPDSTVPSSFSASLGSAAEVLSLPPSVLNSGAKSGRSTGHTHFGQECYGPEPGEAIPPNPPANAELNKNSALQASVPSSAPTTGSATALLAAANAAVKTDSGEVRARRESMSESMNGDEESLMSPSARMAGGKELALHRCESCLKVYRHPSCLIKHRWEHTVYWKEASKFLMSKHQQVQLLEAAAILVNLDGDAQSLPDEKALWPAAVSPAASGLLGSDRVNFDKLMQRKAALRGRTPSVSSSSMPREGFFDADSASSAASPSPLPRSISGGLSPLNSFTKLGLNGPPSASRFSNSTGNNGYSFVNGNGSYPAPSSFLSGSHRLNSDIAHLALDESEERNTATGLSVAANGAPSSIVAGTSSTVESAGADTTGTTSSSARTAGTNGTSGASSTSRTEEEGESSMGGSSPASSRSPAEEEDDEEEEEEEEGDGDVSGGSSLGRRGVGSGGGDGGRRTVGSGGKKSEKHWGLHEDALAQMDMDE